MLYHLENELRDHSVGLKLALKAWQGTEPDLLLITEDGSKVFTKSIILSLYSKVFCDILENHNPKFPEVPTVFLSISSAPPVLNLLKILTEGIVLSTDSQALLEVGKVAQLLDIKLEGMQLGSRKTPASAGKQKKVESPPNEAESERTAAEVLKGSDENGFEGDASIEVNIKSEIDSSKTPEEEDDNQKQGRVGVVKGQKDCNECGKTFTTKQALDRHLMLHTGEKPFKCDECDKAFVTVFSMKQHKITHSDVKPFACHCGVQFTLKASLKRHEEKAH